MRGAILLAAALLGGCATAHADRATTDAAKLATALAGRVPGAARTCISLTTTSSPRIIGQTLLYQDGRQLWVSEAVGCRSLRGDAIPVFEVYGSRLCADDRFRTIRRGSIGIPGPYCRIGRFVPYVTSE